MSNQGIFVQFAAKIALFCMPDPDSASKTRRAGACFNALRAP